MTLHHKAPPTTGLLNVPRLFMFAQQMKSTNREGCEGDLPCHVYLLCQAVGNLILLTEELSLHLFIFQPL